MGLKGQISMNKLVTFLVRATLGTLLFASLRQFVSQSVHFYFSKLILRDFLIMYGDEILHESCMYCYKLNLPR